MSTFIIQVNPTADGQGDAFVIYNALGKPSIEQVRQWAYEGEHELYKLRATDADIIQVDDASEALIDPSMVTGLITELPVRLRRKRTA